MNRYAPNAYDVINRLRISEIWRALGGGELRLAGKGKYRGRAWWRQGDAWSVALDDSRAVWYDFRDCAGGGILDLVVHARGGDRQRALKWLAPMTGVVLENEPFSSADRAEWARQQRDLERDLPDAVRWRRAAVLLADIYLDHLKAPLADPKSGPTDWQEIPRVEQHLTRLRRLTGPALVEEYKACRESSPLLTSALVQFAARFEVIDERALLGYWDAMGARS